MGPGEAMVGITFFSSVAAVLILRGPLGKALAERIAGRKETDAVVSADLERLNEQLEDVRHRLMETEERLDFAERLLSQQKQQNALPER